MSKYYDREENIRRSSPINSRAPYFEQLPHDGLIIEGTIANFSCKVTGSPVPTITWTRNHCPIVNDHR